MADTMGAELTLLVINELMGGYGGKGAIATYLWEDAGVKRVLDSAVAAAKTAGVSSPKTASAKSRDRKSVV